MFPKMLKGSFNCCLLIAFAAVFYLVFPLVVLCMINIVNVDSLNQYLPHKHEHTLTYTHIFIVIVLTIYTVSYLQFNQSVIDVTELLANICYEHYYQYRIAFWDIYAAVAYYWFHTKDLDILKYLIYCFRVLNSMLVFKTQLLFHYFYNTVKFQANRPSGFLPLPALYIIFVLCVLLCAKYNK